MAQRLSCSAACGIVSDQGLNPSVSPALATGFFTTESLGKPHTHAHKLSSEIQGTDLWLPEMGFVGEMDKDSQKLQASSYKINKTWA